MKRRLLTVVIALLMAVVAYAEPQAACRVDSLSKEFVAEKPTPFLPTARRIDRHLDRNKFVYRNEVMLGLTASYGTMNANDSELLLVVSDIDFGLRRTTVNPFVAYAYKDNRAVGLRFGYEYINGDLGNISLDLGSALDMELGISGVGLKSESYSWSLFHRNYIGLDRKGIIGAILEAELRLKTGNVAMYSETSEGRDYNRTRNFTARLNLNPGLAVYVFPEVCVTVTVGIGGLFYNKITQVDAYGVETGVRNRTGLQFKVNIADIQIGVVAHLWNKKKK